MSNDRVTVLKSLIEKNANDPFPRYALAMEYIRTERVEEALEIFSHLLESNPDYVPTYFQAGMAFRKAGETERARQVFRKGIEIAERLGNIHSKNELENALQNF
ncbi:MAG: tetratricopeptide repeat protein [Acidobacteria bacterium]|nr:tetratricopeptide repeat protein [Acidobacteriota bacterium]